MAIVVEDQFTRAADAALTAHTPTPTGTSWTQVYLSGAAVMNVIASTDRCQAGSGVSSGDGQACTVEPAPSVAEVDVQVELEVLNTSTSNRGCGLFARRTDNNNLYSVQILPNEATPAQLKIFKRVASVNTELGSSASTLAVNDVIKFEVRDAAKKCFQGVTERISTTDNALTSNGTWGLSCGSFPGTPDTVRQSTWEFDNFTCTEVAGGAAPPPPRRIIISRACCDAVLAGLAWIIGRRNRLGQDSTPQRTQGRRAFFAVAVAMCAARLFFAPLAQAQWASVGTLGTANDKTAGSSIVLTTTAAAEAGNVVIVSVALDNNGSADGDNGECTSVSDSAGGNTWTKAREFQNAQGGAATGATVCVFYSKLTNQINSSGTITANFGHSPTASAVGAWEFTIGSGNIVSIQSGTDLANDGADPGSMDLTVPNQEFLWVRALAQEGPSSDGFSKTGSYTNASCAATSGGGAASNVAFCQENDIFSGTSNPSDPGWTQARDGASVLVVLTEAAPSVNAPPRRVIITLAAPAGQAKWQPAVMRWRGGRWTFEQQHFL